MEIGLFAKDRPVLDLERSPLETVAEAVSLAGLVALAGLVLHFQSRLPAVVPTRFDLDGQVIGWGPRWLVLGIVPALTLFVWGVMTVAARFPHRHNYLWPITPENARALYGLSRELLAVVKVLTVWLLTTLNWGICRQASGAAGISLPALLALYVVAVAAATTIYLLRMARAR